MRKDLMPAMREFNAMSKARQIGSLCAVHECSEKIKKIHYDQYVKRQWNPHRPQRFAQWWSEIGTEATEQKTDRAWAGIDAVRAFNCEVIREVYREHKQVGIVDLVEVA